MKKVRIRTYNWYKYMKNTVSIWWLLKPKFERRWSGKIIYIGLIGWGIEIDMRGINNIEDFAKALIKG